MADKPNRGGVSYRTFFEKGQLHHIDNIDPNDPEIGPVIKAYADTMNANKQSLHWQRSVRWIENIFFANGRHYVDDVMVSRLGNSSTSDVGDLSIVQEGVNQVPKPTNDLLGRYIETNVALLTENRPRPRVTSKSDKDEDQTAAELSELTLEYLWEALKMPEKHRDMARLIMTTGVCFLEVAWDPTKPRTLQVASMKEEIGIELPDEATLGAGGQSKMVTRQIPVVDDEGRPVMNTEIEYGDISAKLVSPFQLHVPSVHSWNDENMGWVMKEEFVPIDMLKDKYLRPGEKVGLTKRNGWNIDSLKGAIGEESVTSLALWWWERISELVEGPGPSIYIGSPDYWEGYSIVRTFDRAPSPRWPKGRTIITVGDEVLYDSPKKVGARAYDPRWPDRWHPYIRYRWEPMTTGIHGRALVSKLLPKLKRVNAIDTTMIMWRRTVPIATWVAPKGSQVIEDQWSGKPGMIWEYDARRTAGNAPTPVYPPPYPANANAERETQIAEMESIAGTEQILRGERPVGVNSAAMVDILRKQALASRSAILQSWDESIQDTGSAFLQETIRHVGNDQSYAERLRILAREKHSHVSIEMFSGAALSDNVQVRVDTASMALVSKEAREAKVIEIMQYLPNIQAIEDVGLRQAILDELGLKKALLPSGPDVNRAKKMVSLIKNDRAAMITMMQEDDPSIFHAILTNEIKQDGFITLPQDQQEALIQLQDVYKRMLEMQQMQQQQQMMQMMQLQMAMKGGGGGQEGGGQGGPQG
jgi:hypothetical protein